MPALDPASSFVSYAPTNAPDQFLSLYAEHADTARALACRLLYDRCEAEDIVQDVFLTLWRRPDCLNSQRGTSRAWLLTVVRNRSLDCLRRRCRRPREDVSDLADRLPDPAPVDMLDDLTAASRAELVWRLVAELPTSQADLIRRAFVNGQTHREIANETGLPLGTVKSRIRLGLEKLRCAMQNPTLAAVDC